MHSSLSAVFWGVFWGEGGEGYKRLFLIDKNIIVVIFLCLNLIPILVKKEDIQRTYALEIINKDKYFQMVDFSLRILLFRFCLFLNCILSFSTFFVYEVTLLKTWFSASFSSKKTCNLSSIAKAFPKFTADFESISIASSSLSSDSE